MPVNHANLIDDTAELMFRQAHPLHVQEGRPWSRLFCPTEADKGHLSVDRERHVSAKEAYERYLSLKDLPVGGGVWGVSVGEFGVIGLQCFADPLHSNHAHTLVDFASTEKNQMLGLSKLAYSAAISRGKLFP